MKHWFYRLEITDGEHGYYSKGVLIADSHAEAIKKVNSAAKSWYPKGERFLDDDNLAKKKTEDFIVYEHLCGDVLCQGDELREIPIEHYEVLKQYL